MTDATTESLHPEPQNQLGFLDVLYNTLFHPVSTFQGLAESTVSPNRPLFYALITVILVSAMAPLVKIANMGGQPIELVFAMPTSTVAGVIVWGMMTLLIGLLAYAFTGQARFRTFLTLSGLAALPWLLMGAVCVLKFGIGPVGSALSIIGTLLIWLWSVLLFGLALMHTYRMTAERAMILLATPFAAQFILLGWILGFAGNIRQLAAHL